MKKVLRIKHGYKSIDEVQFALDGLNGSPGLLAAYATHSKQGDSAEPDCVISLHECQFSDDEVLLNGTRYAWISDEEYSRLKVNSSELAA